MIAVIPVITTGAEPLHTFERKRTFVSRACRIAQQAEIFSDIVVASDDERLLETLPAEVQHIAIAAQENSSGMNPRGIIEALGPLTLQGRITILDFRAGLITAEDIQAVCNTQSYAASASEPTDHPCQTLNFTKATNAHFLHRLKADDSGRTHPYPSPVPHRAKGTAETIHDDGTASLMADIKKAYEALQGLGCNEAITHVACDTDGVVSACIAGDGLHFLQSPPPSIVELQVPATGQCASCSQRTASSLVFGDIDTTGPLLLVELDKRYESGPFDFRRSSQEGEGWKRDQSGRIILADGTIVHGRQALPSMPMRDGAITVGTAQEILSQGTPALVHLPNNTGRLIQTELYCIRAELHMEENA